MVICVNINGRTQFLEDFPVQFELSNQFVFTGYISDIDLNYLCLMADLFFFQSLLRFWFCLEAMTCKFVSIVSGIPIFHKLFDYTIIYFEVWNQVDLLKEVSKLYQLPIVSNEPGEVVKKDEAIFLEKVLNRNFNTN